MIRLAINGATGRMGALTCTLACDDSRFELVARIGRDYNATAGDRDAKIDVVIDFSTDEVARYAANLATRRPASLTVGTPGFARHTTSPLFSLPRLARRASLEDQIIRRTGTPCFPSSGPF